MKVGDYVYVKGSNWASGGIILKITHRGYDHRGKLLLCKVSHHHQETEQWWWTYELEVIYEGG